MPSKDWVFEIFPVCNMSETALNFTSAAQHLRPYGAILLCEITCLYVNAASISGRIADDAEMLDGWS